MDMKAFVRNVQEFAAYKNQIDNLTAMQKDVKEQINQGLDEFGEEDSRGHVVVDVNDPASGITKVVRQRKVSKNLDIDTAQQIITERGLEDTCLVYVPSINEEAIMAAFYDGKLTEEDIDKMFPSKVTWALTFQKS